MQTPASPNDPFGQQQPPTAAASQYPPQKPRETAIPKTLGILNIVFGVVFMLAGVITIFQYLMMPMVGQVMQTQQQQLTKQIESNQKQKVDKLRKEQKAATSEVEKAAIENDIKQIESQPQITPVTPPNVADMMGMSDRRVVVWGVVNGLSGALLNILMAVSGVGLILLKRWGLSLALWAAGLKLVRIIISTGYYCMVCIPIVAQGFIGMMEQMGAQAGPAQQQAPPEMGAMMAAMYWGQSIGFALFASIYPIICLILLTRPRVKAAFDDTTMTPPQ